MKELPNKRTLIILRICRRWRAVVWIKNRIRTGGVTNVSLRYLDPSQNVKNVVPKDPIDGNTYEK